MSSLVVDGVHLESPLAGRIRSGAFVHCAGATMREVPFVGHINLRGDPENASFTDEVARILGVRLPIDPNTVGESGERRVCWLAPNEWLSMCAGHDERALASRLREALRSQFASVVAIGGGQTVFRVEGGGARELLARGCPLDLHPRIFQRGQCAQSHLAKAPVLLCPVDEGIDVIVRRSFADYLWQWLATAAD